MSDPISVKELETDAELAEAARLYDELWNHAIARSGVVWFRNTDDGQLLQWSEKTGWVPAMIQAEESEAATE